VSQEGRAKLAAIIDQIRAEIPDEALAEIACLRQQLANAAANAQRSEAELARLREEIAWLKGAA
jgi:hypothetical protein